MKKRQFKKLDNSISSFQWIKKKSEKYWQKVDLMECWGFQIQEGSKWKKIDGFRRYTCGVGIQFFVLKPKEIATVFEPHLTGNLKTKFRYRLGNTLSNEFDGSINDKYFEKID